MAGTLTINQPAPKTLTVSSPAPTRWLAITSGGSKTISITQPAGDSITLGQVSNNLMVVSQPAKVLTITMSASKTIEIVSPTAGASGVKNNATTLDPTVNDDAASGYSVASKWLNTATPAMFVCFDATTGASVWREVPLW